MRPVNARDPIPVRQILGWAESRQGTPRGTRGIPEARPFGPIDRQEAVATGGPGGLKSRTRALLAPCAFGAYLVRRWLKYVGCRVPITALVGFLLCIVFLALNAVALRWARQWLAAEQSRWEAILERRDAFTVDALADQVRGLGAELNEVERKAEKAQRLANSVSGRLGNAVRRDQEEPAQVIDNDEPQDLQSILRSLPQFGGGN